MRISDWSSDVCSSDLGCRAAAGAVAAVTVAGVVDRPAARTQGERAVGFAARIPRSPVAAHLGVLRGFRHRRRPLAAAGQHPGTPLAAGRAAYRSEEHTSELQSLMRISYAVFCLKKQKIRTTLLI